MTTGRPAGERAPGSPQVGSETGDRRAGRLLAFGLVLVVACGPPTSAQSTARPSSTPFPLPTLAAREVARGRAIYLQHCATCHGADAQGAPDWQQPDARGDLPAPPHDDTGHTWRHSDAQLQEIIRDGLRDPFNKTLELTMPSFGTELNELEIGDLIAYFKSLWSTDQRQFQEQQSRRPPIPIPSPSLEGGR